MLRDVGRKAAAWLPALTLACVALRCCKAKEVASEE